MANNKLKLLLSTFKQRELIIKKLSELENTQDTLSPKCPIDKVDIKSTFKNPKLNIPE